MHKMLQVQSHQFSSHNSKQCPRMPALTRNLVSIDGILWHVTQYGGVCWDQHLGTGPTVLYEQRDDISEFELQSEGRLPLHLILYVVSGKPLSCIHSLAKHHLIVFTVQRGDNFQLNNKCEIMCKTAKKLILLKTESGWKYKMAVAKTNKFIQW